MSKLEFTKKHPIIFNAILIMATLLILSTISLIAMDIFTEHSKTQEVPDLRGKPLNEAIEIIESSNLKWEIADSAYNDKVKPGCIIEQSPKALSQVKSKRTIYLTVAPLNPRSASFPRIKDLSERQGKSILESLGFKNIKIQKIPSEFSGLILGVSVNGKEVETGTKVLLSSQIIIRVGDGIVVNDTTNTTTPEDTLEDAEDYTDSSLI